MTTPLSKMVALLVQSPLTPRRGRGSAGSLSEVKKGVAWSWHGRVGADLRRRKYGEEFRGRKSAPAEGLGLPLAFRIYFLRTYASLRIFFNMAVT